MDRAAGLTRARRTAGDTPAATFFGSLKA